ncbi:hypothetical protein EVAR_44770_1 [Eumeta japonica]|uniref:Uncharacterized protein n=1 Tax=Eumeta variegata TaxID=151549 RepID=A0A4C1Y904_EUMVA|nr:hypothetical protein EVAR_44770_1 [Eumeta japonica]
MEPCSYYNYKWDTGLRAKTPQRRRAIASPHSRANPAGMKYSNRILSVAMQHSMHSFQIGNQVNFLSCECTPSRSSAFNPRNPIRYAASALKCITR